MYRIVGTGRAVLATAARRPMRRRLKLSRRRLQPFFDQVDRYHELEMPEQETAYCMGVIVGIYRYERESMSEFTEWSVDIPAECAGFLLDRWRKRNREKDSADVMQEFIRERCPEWSNG
jgi:hypothetical protein